MRSTRLLFLLIITQCYLIFTEANINSLEGTVYDSPNHRLSRDVSALSQTDQWSSNDGARFIRDTSEITLTKEDDLNGLSANELESRLAQAEQHMNDTAAKQTRIEGDLEIARKASEAANSTLNKADGDWKAALAEKDRLEEPMKEVIKDISAKKKKVQALKKALSSVQVSFPPEVKDKNAHALNASNFAQQALPVVKQRIKELDEKKITEWEKARDDKATEKDAKEKYLNSLQTMLQKCPVQKADTESKAANGKPERQVNNCTEMLQMAEAANKQLTQLKSQLTTAEKTLENGLDELKEKKGLNIHLQNELVNWQAYSAAFNNVSLAVEELKNAEKKIAEPPEELTIAIISEQNKLGKLNEAKEAAPRLAAKYTRLEAELTAAKTEVSEAVKIRDYYKSKYDDQSTPTPVVTAGPPLGLIVGCIVGALAVAGGAGAAFYFLWWKKRKNTGKKENTKDDEDDDSDGSKEGGKKDKVKAKKTEKTKSDKTKSDEAQKSGEKKDEKEKSKPDDPGVKVACGMKSHGKTEKVITNTSREELEIDEDYVSNGFEVENPIVTEKKTSTKTVYLMGKLQDKDATMDARLEWEQPAEYAAKSQSKMDPAEIHRQVLHFLGSMDFHKINDLISRNEDYSKPSIEFDAGGQIGYTITGRCDTIKTEDDMEGYHNHHANERSSFNDGMLIQGY